MTGLMYLVRFQCIRLLLEVHQAQLGHLIGLHPVGDTFSAYSYYSPYRAVRSLNYFEWNF